MDIKQKGSAGVVVLLVILIAIAIGYYAYTNRAVEQNNVENVETASEEAELLTIQAEGGLCVYGQCGSKITVQNDGTYVYQVGQNEPVSGTVNASDLSTLKQLIVAANFAEIKSVPFTDTCPIAYDGSKFVYTFNTTNGAQTIDSCETKVDVATPLFSHIEKIQTEIVNAHGI